MDDESLANAELNSLRRTLARKLLVWFGRAARDLPWRRTTDLYAIWISEVMLQQTQVATVVPYYDRFLKHFPDVRSLAAADEQQVLRLWEGLGYYRRARQLHAAARRIANEFGGQFPTAYEAVRSLPGIGRYTAGAILSIGRDARLPILEANTIRVLSRLFAYRGDPASASGRRHLWSLAELLLPPKNCGSFNQALMELGSEICKPRTPACERCPIALHCRARIHGLAGQIPRLFKRTQYESVREVAVVVWRGPRVLLRQCQPGERWAGLWDFPRYAGNADEIARQVARLTGEQVRPGARLTTLNHGVTRFRITLECYQASLRAGRSRRSAAAGIRWLLPSELAAFPLSATGRKLAHLVVTRATSPIPSRRRGEAVRPANIRRKRG